MSDVGDRNIPPLNWDVLVTPGIPIATSDLPPGTKQAMFQAIASTLIFGKRDAVLVDAFMTVKQADALVDWGNRQWQKPDNNLYHAWPWRPLVWNRSAS